LRDKRIRNLRNAAALAYLAGFIAPALRRSFSVFRIALTGEQRRPLGAFVKIRAGTREEEAMNRDRITITRSGWKKLAPHALANANLPWHVRRNHPDASIIDGSKPPRRGISEAL
jgi:hypothetical protein